MTYQMRVENTGGYDYDKKKSGKTGESQNGKESFNVQSEYQKYLAEQNARFEQFKKGADERFNSFVQESNTTFEIYKNGGNIPENGKGVVAKSNKPVTTGLPIEEIPHYEIDANGNPVNNYYDASGKLIKSVPVMNDDRAKANQNYANAIANPDNWVEMEAEPAITPPTMEQVADPNANPTENENPTELHMADYLTNLSDETVSYLKGDKKFTENSDEFIALEVSIAKNNALLKEAKENLKNAKAKFENTSYQDFDAKSAAQDAYFNAQKAVQDLQFKIQGDRQDQQVLMGNMMSYASTIENWEDGQTHHLTVTISGYGEMDGFYDRNYKSVTLPDGRKAYEYNGEYYELASDGKPSLFDKIEE